MVFNSAQQDVPVLIVINLIYKMGAADTNIHPWTNVKIPMEKEMAPKQKLEMHYHLISYYVTSTDSR